MKQGGWIIIGFQPCHRMCY